MLFGMGGGTYATDHVLLVGGLGGEPQYTQEFATALSDIKAVLLKGGYPEQNIHLLREASGENTKKEMEGKTASTLANLTNEFDRLNRESKPEDTFLLILLGHGQSDYQEPRFNLPGPDLTAHALLGMLNALPVKDQRLILLFSCSGHFSEIVTAPTRTILASTDGPRQIYHSVAIPLLAKTLDPKAADSNNDGNVSFLEVFDLFSNRVTEHFKTENLLVMETPSLEDNGDGKVTVRTEKMDAGDGTRAATVFILPAPASRNAPKSADPSGGQKP